MKKNSKIMHFKVHKFIMFEGGNYLNFNAGVA